MSVLFNQIILFSVMFIIAMTLNTMNVMVYSTNHLYFSLPLVYSSLYMASTMIWGHQLVHYLQMGHFNLTVFWGGVTLSLLLIYIMRNQIGVSPDSWLRRMIPHHSMALTTTTKLIHHNNLTNDSQLYRLGKGIIYGQEKEIILMESLL